MISISTFYSNKILLILRLINDEQSGEMSVVTLSMTPASLVFRPCMVLLSVCLDMGGLVWSCSTWLRLSDRAPGDRARHWVFRSKDCGGISIKEPAYCTYIANIKILSKGL